MMYKYTSYRQSYAEEGQLLVPEALYEPQISEIGWEASLGEGKQYLVSLNLHKAVTRFVYIVHLINLPKAWKII